MSATPAEPRRAPLLGEHTAEVLGELLGSSARECARLAAPGVV
jgi:crotonobetainyl-CoA:carnitine CoA-transferase CaiB-like acyl-CoA transferase